MEPEYKLLLTASVTLLLTAIGALVKDFATNQPEQLHKISYETLTLAIILLLIIVFLLFAYIILPKERKPKKVKPKKIKPNTQKPNLMLYKDYKWNFILNSSGLYLVEAAPFCKDHGIKLIKDDYSRLYCPECNKHEFHSIQETNQLLNEVQAVLHSKGINYFKKHN